ncbi:MAG TPA: ABC transporter substrate-binding protein [Pseudonocardiaceae bacterium]|jgi:branched-chain amino acid transport system substrate-binding protein|nr:ABC transporter substrate-binding protein [Pseudonocardiaceae bacterium]
MAAMAHRFTRRDVLKAAAVLGAGSLAAACSSGLKGSSTGPATTNTLKIGYVSPQTGPLASFATGDNYIINKLKPLLSKGFTAGGKTWNIEVVVKDSQSTTTRTTEVTQQLINSDNVDIVVASATPDTANPVSDTCEAAGIPNVTTIVPWEAWFLGRGKKPGEQFNYSTMFFFGMKEFTDLFLHMWQTIGISAGPVACLWPNDTDANAFRAGFPPAMTPAGYTAIDGGAYQDGITDFSAQIAKFKQGNAELFTCTPIPPDFQTFWKQAAQQGFKPKLATVAKVMLFPSEAVALGSLSNNIATDVWWSPFNPYKSAFDGTTAKQLADDFASSTGSQWTQALGSVYSLFEIAVQALKTASDPRDRKDVADKLKQMKIDGISGPLDFTTGPQPGIALQKICGGQWRPGKQFPWDMTIVDNKFNPDIPVNGTLQATNA